MEQLLTILHSFLHINQLVAVRLETWCKKRLEVGQRKLKHSFFEFALMKNDAKALF